MLVDVAGVEPALQYTRMFFGRVTTSHSRLYCLTISRPYERHQLWTGS